MRNRLIHHVLLGAALVVLQAAGGCFQKEPLILQEDPCPGGPAETIISKDPELDLVLVLDTSGSTASPSGVDVDGDGIVGKDRGIQGIWSTLTGGASSSDPGDTVLAAQIVAACRLIMNLDPTVTRIGLIRFAGDYDTDTGNSRNYIYPQTYRGTPDAEIVVPLTTDYNRIRMALNSIFRQGGSGATNTSNGIKAATRELSAPGEGGGGPAAPRRRMVLLTDGVPTFPMGAGNVSNPTDRLLAVKAAHEASEAGVRVDIFALGNHFVEGRDDIFTRFAKEVASLGRGHYFAIRPPGAIIEELSQRFAEFQYEPGLEPAPGAGAGEGL